MLASKVPSTSLLCVRPVCVLAAFLHEPQFCYILDGILFLYGLVLTILYFRLKVSDGAPHSNKVLLCWPNFQTFILFKPLATRPGH